MRLIDIDDDRNCYCGTHGEYENYNINPEVLNNDFYLNTGQWVEVNGYVTPGGDPMWACSECGKGLHVYGIEHGTYGADVADHQWVACPNCGAIMMEGENKMNMEANYD